jgi:hypothetical protein
VVLDAWRGDHARVTQQCLKQFIDTQVRKITIEAIQRAVAEQFGMRVAELKQKNNSRQIVVPRQIAMYLAKQLTEASLPEIGRQFGGKHHTTVMHSIAKIDEHRRGRQGHEPHHQQADGDAELHAAPGNNSFSGQLGHRDQDDMLKDNDTDFPEPDAKAEHTGR